LHRLATVLGWSPFGLAWAAAGDAATGHPGTAAVRLVLAVAVLVAALALWGRALAEQLVTPATSGPARAVAGGSRLDRVLPQTPAGAVAVRCLRYWRRDSRYLTAAVTTLLLPLLVVALGVLEVVPLGLGMLWLGPVIAAALAWGLHNDVAYDGPAAWMHVAAGLRGVDDRVGRSVALLVWGAPLTLAACVLGAAWARPDLLPAVLGAAAGLLLGGLGVSAVVSATVAYPVPEAGQNPFASQPGAGTRILAGQTISSLATFVVALPALVPAVLAQLLDVVWLGWLAVALGAGVGAVVLVVGCRLGGRLLARRWPELLGQVRAAR
jgi:ABC-2 type transport system permease protein